MGERSAGTGLRQNSDEQKTNSEKYEDRDSDEIRSAKRARSFGDRRKEKPNGSPGIFALHERLLSARCEPGPPSGTPKVSHARNRRSITSPNVTDESAARLQIRVLGCMGCETLLSTPET